MFFQKKQKNTFHSPAYMRHTQRRLEHLASLGLDFFNKTILEPGAGTNDHSLFYLDRGCHVTSVEPRKENVETAISNYKKYFPEYQSKINFICSDVNSIEKLTDQFDIVHAYGVLYHVSNPEKALKIFADRCRGFMVLETCVSAGRELDAHIVSENQSDPTQAIEGVGCRPTRGWIVEELKQHFDFVYVTKTQPSHPEFPLSWDNQNTDRSKLTRAVFVASRSAIVNNLLLETVPDVQFYA